MSISAEYPDPVCLGCSRHPDEIAEYSPAMTETTLSPAEYVRREEGTYNRRNGHFLCTACYVSHGMPSSPGGWVAP